MKRIGLCVLSLALILSMCACTAKDGKNNVTESTVQESTVVEEVSIIGKWEASADLASYVNETLGESFPYDLSEMETAFELPMTWEFKEDNKVAISIDGEKFAENASEYTNAMIDFMCNKVYEEYGIADDETVGHSVSSSESESTGVPESTVLVESEGTSNSLDPEETTEANSITKEELDDTFIAMYGMPLNEYLHETFGNVDFTAIIGEGTLSAEYNYKVDGSKLYLYQEEELPETAKALEFEIADGVLTITDPEGAYADLMDGFNVFPLVCTPAGTEPVVEEIIVTEESIATEETLATDETVIVVESAE